MVRLSRAFLRVFKGIGYLPGGTLWLQGVLLEVPRRSHSALVTGRLFSHCHLNVGAHPKALYMREQVPT